MKRLAIQVAAVATFILFWKSYVTLYDVSPFVLPPPEDVVIAFFKMMATPSTYMHLTTTLAECLGGFALATIFGTIIGQILGRSDLLDTIFKPFVIALQVTPKVALIPLFILWFGFGMESKLIVSSVLAFFPVFANSYLGAKSVDRGLAEVFAVGNASMSRRLYLLVVPSSLPYILTGMEMAIVLAIIGAVVAEFVAGTQGLGYLATIKLQDMEVDTLFAVVMLLAVIGFCLYVAVGSLRKVLIPWHESSTRVTV
jgi:NitT/TauT family transport system permease protein